MLVSQHRFGIFIYASAHVNQSEGDPFMTLIPAVSQYLSRYDCTVPELPGYSHYVSVTVPTDELSNLYLDGVKVTYYANVYHGNVSSFTVYNVKIGLPRIIAFRPEGQVWGRFSSGTVIDRVTADRQGLNPKGNRWSSGVREC